MLSLIVRRIGQSSSLRSSLGAAKGKANVAQLALSFRFKILAISMQLVFTAIFSLNAVYEVVFREDTHNDAVNYLRCKILDEPRGETCVSTSIFQGSISLLIITAFSSAVASVILAFYSTIPTLARAVWIKHAHQLQGLLRSVNCRKQ
jgi:hypothetical protein